MGYSEMKAKRVPGVIAVVGELPDCNFCEDGPPARYDFRTQQGSWANACHLHFCKNAATLRLGLGQGQYLVTEAEVGDHDLPEFVKSAVLRFEGVLA